MSIFNKTLTIDFGNISDAPEIKLVQGEEDARVIHLKLSDGNTAVNLTGCTARIYVLPCGETTPLYEDLTVITAASGKVDYVVSGNAAAIAGAGKFWIEIIQTGSPDPLSVGYSKEGKLSVAAKQDFTGAIIASTVFSALQSALATVATYLSRIVALETADTQNFKLSGNQSAAGNKTFTGIVTFSNDPVLPNPAWIDATTSGAHLLLGTWAGHVKYKKVGNRVYVTLDGLTNPSAVGTPAYNFPVGLRPGINSIDSFTGRSTGADVRAVVTTTGDLYLQSPTGGYNTAGEQYDQSFEYLAEG